MEEKKNAKEKAELERRRRSRKKKVKGKVANAVRKQCIGKTDKHQPRRLASKSTWKRNTDEEEVENIEWN